MTVTRKLAAILAADVVGYSRIMGIDEEGTLERLKAHRRELIDPKIAEHHGRIVKTTGDGLLVEFASVVDAVRCAVEMQQRIDVRNADVAADRRIEFRVGINLGDIIVDGDDIHGDGVNVAARLEAMAKPGAVCVSAGVWEQVRGKVSFGADDLGVHELKNIERPVHVFQIASSALMPTEVASKPALSLPDKPSIAVLPFTNMSGDPEQEYFADGLTEDITTALSRVKWFFVIARNSSFTYKGRVVDVKQAARELGVRYILEGSVRKAGNRVRITGQLIDAATGNHIWADRFDGALDDIFDLQDQVTASVVGMIEPRLRHAEMERVRHKPTESLDAYDLFLRALACHRLSFEDSRRALTLLYRAIEIDPSYAPAVALAARCYQIQRSQGWLPPSHEAAAEGVRLARQAIRTGNDDPEALWMGGYAIAYLAGEHDFAASAIERALSLNPNSANAWLTNGWVQVYQNQPEPALVSFQRAARLSPLDPNGHTIKFGMAAAHFCAGRYYEAETWTDRALREHDTFAAALRQKVALAGLRGGTEAGAPWVDRLLAVYPSATVANIERILSALVMPDVLARYVEGLRKAGLPE